MSAQTLAPLDLSRDLRRLGIASFDMEPNRSELDSGPLLRAAIDYAKRKHVTRIVANPGAYYFRTLLPSGGYIDIAGLDGLTVDLQGADLYFGQSHRTAIAIRGCTHCRFENFTIDYLQLPFTQLIVRQSSPEHRTVMVETMQGVRSARGFQCGTRSRG